MSARDSEYRRVSCRSLRDVTVGDSGHKSHFLFQDSIMTGEGPSSYIEIPVGLIAAARVLVKRIVFMLMITIR